MAHQCLLGSWVYCSVLGMKEYSPDLWLLQFLNKTKDTPVISLNAFTCQASKSIVKFQKKLVRGEHQGYLLGGVGFKLGQEGKVQFVWMGRALLASYIRRMMKAKGQKRGRD